MPGSDAFGETWLGDSPTLEPRTTEYSVDAWMPLLASSGEDVDRGSSKNQFSFCDKRKKASHSRRLEHLRSGRMTTLPAAMRSIVPSRYSPGRS